MSGSTVIGSVSLLWATLLNIAYPSFQKATARGPFCKIRHHKGYIRGNSVSPQETS